MALAACTIEGCEGKHVARGFCVAHYERWRRHGNPLGGGPSPQGPGPCSVEGCEKPRKCRGLCLAHYQRWQRWGDPLDSWADRRPLGRRTDRNGYVLTRVRDDDPLGVAMRQRNGAVLEHRLVMARALGRPLRPEENVHHKNGDRADNRLENLELWSSSQPYGQRVADKLAWARELIALYGPEFTETLF